jgi:hypothetical protein
VATRLVVGTASALYFACRGNAKVGSGAVLFKSRVKGYPFEVIPARPGGEPADLGGPGPSLDWRGRAELRPDGARGALTS